MVTNIEICLANTVGSPYLISVYGFQEFVKAVESF